MKKRFWPTALVLIAVFLGAFSVGTGIKHDRIATVLLTHVYDAFCYNGQQYTLAAYEDDQGQRTTVLRPLELVNGWQSVIWSSPPNRSDYTALGWKNDGYYTYLNNGQMLLRSGNQLLLYSMEDGTTQPLWGAAPGSTLQVDSISPEKNWAFLRCVSQEKRYTKMLLDLTTGAVYSDPAWQTEEPYTILGQKGDTLYCSAPSAKGSGDGPYRLFSVNAKTGQEVSLAAASAPIEEGAALSGALYYLQENTLFALNLKTGEAGPAEIDLTDPAYKGGTLLSVQAWQNWLLLALEKDRHLYVLLFEPRRAQPALLATWPVYGMGPCSMRVNEGVLTITNGDALYTYIMPVVPD